MERSTASPPGTATSFSHPPIYDWLHDHEPPRRGAWSQQLLVDSRSLATRLVALFVVANFAAYGLTDDLGHLVTGLVLISFYGWLLRGSVTSTRDAELAVVRLADLSPPRWGSGALARTAGQSGDDGYTVEWRPCAALLLEGPVELLVMRRPGARSGRALAARRAKDGDAAR